MEPFHRVLSYLLSHSKIYVFLKIVAAEPFALRAASFAS